MDDDFNAPAALGVLQDFTRGVNTLVNSDESPTSATLEAISQLYRQLAGDVLGILGDENGGAASAEREAGLIELLVELRNQARQNREWTRADRIRDRLAELGVVLEDRPEGTVWRIAG
jgi:cysteinyl-tRNA synthetase